MALNPQEVQKAIRILRDIADDSGLPKFTYDQTNPDQSDVILLADRKSDGGYEQIFLNVRNITPGQLETFDHRKGEVYNSSFTRVSEDNPHITCIGWF